MTEKHSPTPWLFKWDRCHQIFDDNGHSIMGDEHYYPWAPSVDDMKHIVACVNAHDTLVARVAELEADLKAQLCIDATLVSNNDDLRTQNAALVEALECIEHLTSHAHTAVSAFKAVEGVRAQARAALARGEGQGREG